MFPQANVRKVFEINKLYAPFFLNLMHNSYLCAVF